MPSAFAATNTKRLSSGTEWLELAERSPLAFSLVREDALIDLSVLKQLKKGASVVMIASGGCTAAYLAASGLIQKLTLVDSNAAQLNLSKIKMHLLQVSTQERLALLGHLPMQTERRAQNLDRIFKLLQLDSDALGPPDLIARDGPDFCGRYELLFAALRECLSEHSASLFSLLAMSDPAEQARLIAPGTRLGAALDGAFLQVMSLPNLVKLFGDAATANRKLDFADHFISRTCHVLSTQPASTNPYLWQVLAGKFNQDCFLPWLTARISDLPALEYVQSPMALALTDRDEQFDLVQLSNILDWLSAEQAASTLEIAWRALKPGGYVLIRQLNSTLDITRLQSDKECGFVWLDLAQDLHSADRSYFYHSLYLGQKL